LLLAALLSYVQDKLYGEKLHPEIKSLKYPGVSLVEQRVNGCNITEYTPTIYTGESMGARRGGKGVTCPPPENRKKF
jgi:hypothetical protein